MGRRGARGIRIAPARASQLVQAPRRRSSLLGEEMRKGTSTSFATHATAVAAMMGAGEAERRVDERRGGR